MLPKNVDSLYTARVLTIGAAVATIFGTYWIISGVNALSLSVLLKDILLAVMVGIMGNMVMSVIRLWTSANLFPPVGNATVIQQANLYINVSTGIQILASIVAPVLLTRWGHAGMGFAAVIVTVGLYLVAFAPLLRTLHYYVAGGLLTIVPLVSILFLPETFVSASQHIQVWTACIGIACGLIYLAFGGVNLMLAVRLRRNQPHFLYQLSHH